MTDTTDELETLKNATEPTLADVMNAIADLSGKVDGISERLDAHGIQLEAIRQGLVSNDARFDQLEALGLEAKSIALITRSQLTILTEELRHGKVLA